MSVQAEPVPAPPPAPSGEPLVKIEGIKKYFPITQGILFQHHVGNVHAVDGVDLEILRGPDARAGRGDRVREVHPRARRDAPLRRDRGEDLVPGAGHHESEGQGAPGAPRGHADGVPGPVRVPEPSEDRRDDRVGAVPAPPDRAEESDQVRGAAADGARGAEPRALQPLPARVLGRPAPADRRGEVARAPAEADRLRRAGLRARRLDPGADPQPARGPPGRVQPDLPLHRARPLRGQARLRPRRRDVPGEDRGDGRGRRPLQDPEAPLHGSAAVRGADGGPRARAAEAADHPPGGRARRRSILRPAAGSTRGARNLGRSPKPRGSTARTLGACRRNPSSRTRAPGSAPPAISRWREVSSRLATPKQRFDDAVVEMQEESLDERGPFAGRDRSPRSSNRDRTRERRRNVPC